MPEVWKGIWVVAEQWKSEVKKASLEVLALARKLADKRGEFLSAVLLGYQIKKADQELIYRGADFVYKIDHQALAYFDTDICSNCLEYLVRKGRPSILLAAATTTGKTLMPILAAKLRTGLTADCTDLDIEENTGLLLQTRPAIGGNVMVTIKTPNHRPQMATVRPHSYPLPPRDLSRTGEIVDVDLPDAVFKTRFKLLGFESLGNGEVRLEDAEIIVCAGRGIGKPGNLLLIKELAELLGGAVGATRPVVDQGWLPYAYQVGLSGKSVAPILYIACGVSGAVQHLAGMRGSRFVIAINKDPRAQIFKAANLGIIGDINEILPRLIKRLKSEKRKNVNF